MIHNGCVAVVIGIESKVESQKMEDGRWKMEDFCELNSKFH